MYYSVRVNGARSLDASPIVQLGAGSLSLLCDGTKNHKWIGVVISGHWALFCLDNYSELTFHVRSYCRRDMGRSGVPTLLGCGPLSGAVK